MGLALRVEPADRTAFELCFAPHGPKMHYIDELLALYSGKDAFTRKFILSQALDNPADHHVGELLAKLEAETRTEDALVKRQARYTLGDRLPGASALEYGFISKQAGLWTRQYDGERGVAPEAPPSVADLSATPEARLLAEGAARWLAPQLDALVELMTERGTVEERVRASLVLGRLYTPETLGALAGQVAGVDRPSYQSAFALAEAGTPEAVDAVLQAVRAHGATHPDLYLLLRSTPCAAALACLDEHEPSAGPVGRSNIALALAPHPTSATRPLLERLIRRQEGWVTAYALDTLAAHGEPEDLALVRLAWELEPHEFVRLQALRAAGAIRTDEARAFCLEAMGAPAGRLQAAALEALAAQDLPMERLAELAEPHLKSEFVRTQVQAMLIVARQDPGRVADRLDELVLSSVALRRLEGAFVVGYVRGTGSLDLLTRMATRDPSGAVRLQAIKSLGRFSPEEALPVLVPLLGHAQPVIAQVAARAIGGLADPLGQVPTVLGASLRADLPAPQRAMTLRALGAAVALANGPAPRALVDALASPDPVVTTAALDGLKYLGDQIPVQKVLPLTTSATPGVRARACLVAFLGGVVESVAALDPMLRSGDAAASVQAIDAMLEVALVAPLLSRGPFTAAVTRLRNPPVPPVAVPARPAAAAGAGYGSTVRMRSQSQKELFRLRALPVETPAELVRASGRDLGKLAGPYDQRAAAPDTAAAPVALSGVFPPPSGPAGAASGATMVPRRGARPPDRAAQSVALSLALLAGLGGAVLLRMREEPPPPASAANREARKRQLRAWYVEGACRGTLGGRSVDPVRVGAYLAPGDALELDPGAEAELRDARNTRVRLAGGALAVHPATDGHELELSRGGLEVDHPAVALVVRLGGTRYRSRGGRFKLTEGQSGWRLEVLAGDATIVEDGGRKQVLVSGQSTQVARP